jgi:hypothetical protein
MWHGPKVIVPLALLQVLLTMLLPVLLTMLLQVLLTMLLPVLVTMLLPVLVMALVLLDHPGAGPPRCRPCCST